MRLNAVFVFVGNGTMPIMATARHLAFSRSGKIEMWFPVALHASSNQIRGIAKALEETLEQRTHCHVVDQRRIANSPCDSSSEGAAATVMLLGKCSVAYVGASNGIPVAPFCGFTLASELGVAYLEHLIDYEPLAATKFGKHWLANALFSFVYVLLREHKTLNAVVLPLPIAGDPLKGFRQVPVDDRYHVVRTG